MNGQMENNNNISYLPFMVIYITSAVVFMAVKIFGLTGSFVIKVIPALSLSLAILFTRPMKSSHRIAMLTGALFCGAGDVILDIDRVRFFVPGLAAFLLGHIGFLALFWMRRSFAGSRRVWVITVMLVAITMAIILIPRLGPLMAPVLAYLAVITIMTVLAIMSDVRPMAAAGAGLFMLSDALLALAKFVFNGQPSPLFTIPVYFVGLFLLSFGILLSVRPK
ncbi:MAG: lysoplasmalogenase [Desulfobacteraceae bacterium]|nr:MAG: lysoplasmalogenase [Desulfobacteraceae bacterium]